MAKIYQAGEVVKLKSGGPPMTVSLASGNSSSGFVDCSWFQNGSLHRGQFPDEALELAGDD